MALVGFGIIGTPRSFLHVKLYGGYGSGILNETIKVTPGPAPPDNVISYPAFIGYNFVGMVSIEIGLAKHIAITVNYRYANIGPVYISEDYTIYVLERAGLSKKKGGK